MFSHPCWFRRPCVWQFHRLSKFEATIVSEQGCWTVLFVLCTPLLTLRDPCSFWRFDCCDACFPSFCFPHGTYFSLKIVACGFCLERVLDQTDMCILLSMLPGSVSSGRSMLNRRLLVVDQSHLFSHCFPSSCLYTQQAVISYGVRRSPSFVFLLVGVLCGELESRWNSFSASLQWPQRFFSYNSSWRDFWWRCWKLYGPWLVIWECLRCHHVQCGESVCKNRETFSACLGLKKKNESNNNIMMILVGKGQSEHKKTRVSFVKEEVKRSA